MPQTGSQPGPALPQHFSTALSTLFNTCFSLSLFLIFIVSYPPLKHKPHESGGLVSFVWCDLS